MNKLFSLKKTKVIWPTGLLAVALSGAVVPLSAAIMNVPGRDFPLAYDVDVLVVGGTSGGVAAAVKAAQGGSRVFLMAQRPYLGEDICGAYRLWVDKSEKPLSGLGAKVFQSPAVMESKPVSYEYEADVPSQAPHQDTAKPSKLKDGKKHDMQRETIQYNSALNIIATLPEVTLVDRVDLSTFQFPGSFGIQSVSVSVSDDKKTWESISKEEDAAFAKGAKNFRIPVQRKTRFIKISVAPRARHTRLLLSELEIFKTTASTLKEGEQYPPTPLHVKRTLDNALLEAGVEFLYGCYPTDLLTDSKGAVRGVIMANRAGRQVVRAKTIIDATPTAMLARLAGASMRPEGSTPVFKYTAIVPAPAKTVGVTVAATPVKMYDKGDEYSAFEYTIPVKTGPLDIHSYAEAQQQVFDKVWSPGRLSVSEYAFAVPETSIVSAGRYEGDWAADKIPAAAFQSSQLPGVYVLSGYADVSRECAEKLLRPVHYMKTGERIGQLAADAAKQVSGAGELTVFNKSAGEAVKAEFKESLAGVRPEHAVKERVKIGDTSYPVLGEYDVVVVGGGTSGAPAAIGAARRGAKTLVIEYQHAFGGVGTVGLIGCYWKGYCEGFTKEVDLGVSALGPAGTKPGKRWDVLDKMEWYRREMRKAGAEMWMCSMAWGAVVKDGDVQGVAVSTPFGPGIVLAKVVVDSTGNGDIAIPAGAKYEYYGPSRISVQGTGLSPVFIPSDSYNNSDFTVSYESDVVDTWHLRVYGKSEGRAGDAYDVSSLVNSRERRRVLGDFYLTVPDQLMQRTYPDSIYKAFSDFDCHGVNYSSYFFLQPNPEATSCYVPYRCLLPKGLNGILTTGMGISINNDALPLVRMQPDLQNQGYAAGVAAAMASRAGIEPRNIDIKELQRHLVEIGSLPEEVLKAADNYPLPAERVERAVDAALAEYGEHQGVECSILLSHKEIALPLLRAAYSKTTGENKLFYAHLLAILEDPSGLDTLVEQVNGRPWDKGHPRPTAKMSDMDRLIVSLGLPKDRRATAAIIEKINLLTPASEYSHLRAVAMALDMLKDPAAAPALAALLAKPGMTGHAVHTVAEAEAQDMTAIKNLGAQGRFVFSFETRTISMQELALARALYRCGDYEGVGKKILQDYSTDLRGVLAAHALSVLAEKP